MQEPAATPPPARPQAPAAASLTGPPPQDPGPPQNAGREQGSGREQDQGRGQDPGATWTPGAAHQARPQAHQAHQAHSAHQDAEDGHGTEDGARASEATQRPVAGPARPTENQSRAADTRALTQVLFAELKTLEPGTEAHRRVRSALIEANLPLVRYAAARFRSRNEPMEDVVQVGTIGLINAIDRFDPDRGVQFPTFAMPTVVGEIKRYFRDNVRTVHVPRRLHELWVQVTGATEDLTTAHGRSPTTAEIAERLKISEDEVLACIEAGRSYHATSLEAAQEGDGLPGLLDRLGYEDPALAGVEHRDLVRHLLVQLPEREQRILMLRYYSNLTQSQISQELGVSQMHVSRLLARSFARLRSANRIEA
ncbi:SigB/SigF/SigG family RNA polymerase sigma factor [Streptomyces sp. DW26H14]|uniref:SigB/SigF/SigG family RNA polymerase sigma factor n=1 Tax=Streptomyces sp. DW26H14 TaxID=3435395 RepID=UPI00403E0F03